MKSRRDFLIGGMLLASAGSAYALTPRRKLSLLNGAKLDRMIPRSFGEWKEVPTDALVVPQSEDSLAGRLYTQSVGRVYENADNDMVMMLIAYGDTQSDQLQLHRPEICYPAFGFDVENSRAVSIAVAPGVVIPGRRMVAASNLRREQILYWTRIGEFLPSTDVEQRWMKLRTAMSGLIVDGALVRLSNISGDADAGYRMNQRFASDFIKEISQPARRALVGSDLTQKLSSWA